MATKVGLSIGQFQGAVGDEKALEIAAEIGCDTVDFDLDRYSKAKPNCPYTMNDQEIHEYFVDLRRKAESLGLEISQTHGRLRGYCFNEEMDRQLAEDARLDLMASAALGAKYCVMHSVSSIFAGFDRPADEMRRENVRMYRDFLPWAKEYGVIIALETFGDCTDKTGKNGCDFFGDPKEIMRTYNELCADPNDSDYFCYCMDTGHTNKAVRFGHPNAGELIRMLGKSICILHLNDNDGQTDQHKIPLTGTIDWADTLAALQDVGYKGVYNMELVLTAYGNDLEMMRATGEFALKVMRSALKNQQNRKK